MISQIVEVSFMALIDANFIFLKKKIGFPDSNFIDAGGGGCRVTSSFVHFHRFPF